MMVYIDIIILEVFQLCCSMLHVVNRQYLKRQCFGVTYIKGGGRVNKVLNTVLSPSIGVGQIHGNIITI